MKRNDIFKKKYFIYSILFFILSILKYITLFIFAEDNKLILIFILFDLMLAGIILFGFIHFYKELTIFSGSLMNTLEHMIKNEHLMLEETYEDDLLSKIQHQIYQLNDILELTRDEALNEKKELQSLITDISHQVKTPITNMKLLISVMEEEPEKSDLQNHQNLLNDMHIQIEKLHFLMESMIKTSRLETEMIHLTISRNSIYHTILSALEAIILTAEGKKMQIECNCKDDLYVLHDIKWTTEAIFNILDNAVKYTGDNGSITINVQRQEIYTQIMMIDNGCGIEEEHISAIFKRFYREPRIQNIKGSGIGLYLSREIINRQGGFISVFSEKEKGSKFCIYLLNA